MDKSPDAFRTISEVAEELDVPQHVLRFWETRFRDIKPMKRGGGRRYYRPEDVALLKGIRHLLYGEGYTIRGVQRILRDQGTRFVQNVWEPGAPQPPRGHLRGAAAELEEADAPEDMDADGDEEAATGTRVAAPATRREPVAAPPPRGLSRESQRALHAALHELNECRQLLDAALQDSAPAG